MYMINILDICDSASVVTVTPGLSASACCTISLNVKVFAFTVTKPNITNKTAKTPIILNFFIFFSFQIILLNTAYNIITKMSIIFLKFNVNIIFNSFVFYGRICRYRRNT